jgi:nicotinamidase-related amidase
MAKQPKPKPSLDPLEEEETESKISVPGLTPPLEGLLSRMVKPQTYQALVVLGMQDHLLSDTSLTYIDQSSGFLDRIVSIVTKWRDRAGYVIWVRSAAKGVSDNVPRRTNEMGAFFAKLSNPRYGIRPPEFSDFSPRFQPLINRDQDMVLDAPFYSPPAAREFLSAIKSHLITTMYLCGCLTDASMYSIMLDAARSSCAMHVVADCLGYNDKIKHSLALDYARESMCAQDITSKEIIEDLDAPHDAKTTVADLEALLGTMPVGRGTAPADQGPAEPPAPNRVRNKPKVRSRAEQRRKDAAREKQKEEKLKADALKETSNEGETPKDEKKKDEAVVEKKVEEPPTVSPTPVSATTSATTPALAPEPNPAPTQPPAPASPKRGAPPST